MVFGGLRRFPRARPETGKRPLAAVSAATADSRRRPAGRGVHVYVRIEPRWTFTEVRHAAIAFGRELERRQPREVSTKWWKEERGARVFVDYNQNARDRTIASAYSLRPKPGAPVAAPEPLLEGEEGAMSSGGHGGLCKSEATRRPGGR